MVSPRSGRCTHGKETWYTLYRTLDGPKGESGLVRKILLPPEFDPRNVQSVESRFPGPLLYQYILDTGLVMSTNFITSLPDLYFVLVFKVNILYLSAV